MGADKNILPNGDGCLITKSGLRQKKKVLMRLMDVYFNEYVPRRLKSYQDEEHGKEFEKAWVQVMKCLDLQLTDGQKMDHMRLYDEWREENKRIIDQIGRDYLYTRDVPRKGKLMKYQMHSDSKEIKRHKAEVKKRNQRKKKK